MNNQSEKSLKRRVFTILCYSLIFGILTGVFFAVMCGKFVPVVFTDWAGSFVCEGKMAFQSLQKTFQCYTSPTAGYDLGDKVYWTMFKMFLFPCIALSSILIFIFFATTDLVLTEKE